MRSEPRKPPALKLVGPRTGEAGEGLASDVRRRASRICWTKVRTARARVAAGYYDRESVRAQVLDAVLEEFRRR